MPEAVIVDVTLNQTEAIKQIADLERQIIASKKAIDDLTSATEGNTGAQKASAETLIKLKSQLTALKTEQSGLLKEIQVTNAVLKTNDNSVAGLEAKVKLLTQEWRKAEFGSDKFKVLQTDLKKANEELLKQKVAVGNTGGVFGQFVNGLAASKGAFGAAITGTQGFNTALKANPIGAIVGLLISLVTALQGNAKVADFVTRSMAALNKIFSTLIDSVVSLSEPLMKLFENPKQALSDFGKLLKDNVVNRFEGLIELIPALGNAISLVFQGKFEAAGKTVVDATAKMALGVENFSDKAVNAVNAAKNFGNSLITAGDEGFNAAKKLDELTVSQQALNNEIAKNDQLVKSLTFQLKDKTKTEQERIAIATQISELETDSANKQVSIAQKLLDAEQLRLKGKQLDATEEAALSKLQTDVQIAESEKQIAHHP